MTINHFAQSVEGPFGTAQLVRTVATDTIAAMYRKKLGTGIKLPFAELDEIALYECGTTGFRFWRPETIAGDEEFYREVSAVWPNYYQEWRWEYDLLGRYTRRGVRVLEVGCGRGFFLRSLEGKVAHAEGVEFNRNAIRDKVTRWDISAVPLSQLEARGSEPFDLVCHFQVLEHVTDPKAFLEDCRGLLRPGGYLAIGVPNYDYPIHRDMQDAFDLPPHHVNHFSASAMRRIAGELGMSLRRHKTMPPFPAAGSGFGLRRKAKAILNGLCGRVGEPGHSMLSIFRKP